MPWKILLQAVLFEAGFTTCLPLGAFYFSADRMLHRIKSFKTLNFQV